MACQSIIVMGISGSGKSTIGQLLANCLNISFVDADDYHSESNKEKMSTGIPLDDKDRLPWLHTLRKFLVNKEQIVLACSALKESYRVILDPDHQLIWVFLSGSPELIKHRIAQRNGHYMKEHMIESQLSTLEPPKGAITVGIMDTPDQIVEKVLAQIN